jgi:phosphoribosylformylglycinamidine synthase
MRTYFKKPGLSNGTLEGIKREVERHWGVVGLLESETCFYIECSQGLTNFSVLTWLLSETFEPENFGDKSFLVHKDFTESDIPQASGDQVGSYLLEFGPRLNFSTSWSSNATNIFKTCGIEGITRVERSRRLLITLEDPSVITKENTEELLRSLHDEMTECQYTQPLKSFSLDISPKVRFCGTETSFVFSLLQFPFCLDFLTNSVSFLSHSRTSFFFFSFFRPIS